MHEADKDEWDILNLNDDEANHLKKISVDTSQHLASAENAAVICLNGLMSLKKYPQIGESEAFVSLLMAKSAKNVRYAIKGLKLGYYSGASSVLRSAFEDLAFAILFHSEPSQVAKWFRNEFSKRPFSDLSRLREKQKKEAKKALFSRENSPLIIRDTMYEYVNKANIQIHPSIKGLSEEMGIDLEYFISEEMGKALEEAEGDLTMALEMFVLKSYSRDHMEEALGSEDIGEKVFVELTGRYDEEKLADLSLFAFYISHRLLDFTKIIFEIDSREFYQHYKEWHKTIKDLGWSVGHK